MKKLLVLTITAIVFNLNAQINIDNLLKKQGAQEEININKPDLQKNDLRLISLLPTLRDYTNIKEKIKNLPNDCLRCIDSIDFNECDKDTIIIKIYSQNYAYKSSDSYVLGLNEGSNNDSLWLYYMFYDMEMKSNIDDYTDFINRKLNFTITSKALGDKKKTKRILIKKN